MQKVEAIINPRLLRLYAAKLEEIEGLRRSGCPPITPLAHLQLPVDALEVPLNEVLLFHGAKPDAIDKIVKGGLDPRRGGEDVGKILARRPT